jgi:type I restriction enzyme S subunit
MPDYWGGDIAWITPDDLSGYNKKTIARGARSLTAAGYESCSTRLMPAGAVLFTSRAPIGYVAIASGPVCTNQGFKSFVPGDGLLSDYVYWFLQHATPEMRSRGSGTTFPELSKARAGETSIPIPPQAEQRRIVAAIEEQLSRLDSASVSLHAAHTRLAHYKRQVLARLFPAGAVERSIESLAAPSPSAITDGPFGSNLKTEHYTSAGPRVIRLQNIGDGEFLDAMAHVSQEHFEQLRKHEVLAGDVVVAALGEQLPRACLVPSHVPPAIVKADCFRIRVGTDALPAYLVLALNAPQTRARAARIIHGVGRPRLNLREVRELAIPVPATDRQREIVTEFERQTAAAGEMADAIQRALRRGASLRRSILERAISGQLAAQDPSDEPASVLIERITRARATQANRDPRERRMRV